MRPDKERPGTGQGGDGARSSADERDGDTVSPVSDEAPYILPIPPSALTDATAAPHVDIRELDRRRFWHNRLNAHLGIRRAA